jgi:hypothetical protein
MIGYKILRIFFILLLALTLMSGCMTVVFRGFIDFPCFARYMKESDCLELPEHMRQRREALNPLIETYLSTYIAGWKGASCDYNASPDQSLELSTATGKLTLQLEGESLKVNGQSLGKEEKYNTINIWSINPWAIAQTDLYNRGVIPDCGTQPPNPRLVVTGSYGTKTHLIKGGLITTFLIAGIALTSRKIKGLRAKKQIVASQPY